MKNESGVRQIYYVGNQKRTAEPGAEVPDEHVSPSLREILSPRREAIRPGPSIKKLVDPTGRDGRPMRDVSPVEVGAPRTARARGEVLSSRPTLRARREGLSGWLKAIASPTLHAGSAVWEVSDAWFKDGEPVGELSARLASDMRHRLDGGDVPGLGRVAPIPEVPGGRVLVVLCCCDAPRWEVRAIRAVLRDADDVLVDLVVLEDASAPVASAAVRVALGVVDGTPDDAWVECLPPHGAGPGALIRYIRRSERVGYLRNANDGSAFCDPDRHSAVVWLNGDTDPGRGFLPALLRALYSGPKVGFSSPMSDNNVDWSLPILPGCSSDEMADALLVLHDGTYPEVFLPSAFCLAARPEVWKKFGPFDAETWGTGYGEETDLECKAWQEGWTAANAPDAFVKHARSRSFGDGPANEFQRSAIGKIRAKFPWFDKTYRDKIQQIPFQRVRTRAGCASRLPGDASNGMGDPFRVAFLSRSLKLSGGNLAMFCAGDALRALGWDARFVTTDGRDADMYDSDASPIVFDGEPDLRRSFRSEVFSNGLIVSGSYVTCDAAERIVSDNGKGPALVHVLFEQDDERRFENNHGEGHRARIEAAWRDGNVVAVSEWVADAVEEVRRVKRSGDLPIRPPVLRAGFDPLVWFPRGRAPAERLRVVAFYRPETKHRGSDVLVSAMRMLEKTGAPVDFTLFGSRPPPGLRCEYVGLLPHHRLSRVVGGADVLIDASSFQGFGLDAVQALASGLALVCFDNGGCAEYARDGLNAVVLHKTASSAILAEAVAGLAADRSHLESMQDAAPGSVSGLSWPVLAPEWDAVLGSFLPR